MKLLKDFLDEFDWIGVINFIKGNNGENIMMHQSLCNNVKRIFNGKFIELTNSENAMATNILLCNNPSNIESSNVSESEKSILLHYDDKTINMMGYKNNK